jgi:hypothetical protein
MEAMHDGSTKSFRSNSYIFFFMSFVKYEYYVYVSSLQNEHDDLKQR